MYDNITVLPPRWRWADAQAGLRLCCSQATKPDFLASGPA